MATQNAIPEEDRKKIIEVLNDKIDELKSYIISVNPDCKDQINKDKKMLDLSNLDSLREKKEKGLNHILLHAALCFKYKIDMLDKKSLDLIALIWDLLLLLC